MWPSTLDGDFMSQERRKVKKVCGEVNLCANGRSQTVDVFTPLNVPQLRLTDHIHEK